jgi:hypothetical protein
MLAAQSTGRYGHILVDIGKDLPRLAADGAIPYWADNTGRGPRLHREMRTWLHQEHRTDLLQPGSRPFLNLFLTAEHDLAVASARLDRLVALWGEPVLLVQSATVGTYLLGFGVPLADTPMRSFWGEAAGTIPICRVGGRDCLVVLYPDYGMVKYDGHIASAVLRLCCCCELLALIVAHSTRIEPTLDSARRLAFEIAQDTGVAAALVEARTDFDRASQHREYVHRPRLPETCAAISASQKALHADGISLRGLRHSEERIAQIEALAADMARNTQRLVDAGFAPDAAPLTSRRFGCLPGGVIIRDDERWNLLKRAQTDDGVFAVLSGACRTHDPRPMDPRLRFNLDGEGGQRQRTGLERAAARNALMPQLKHDPPKPPCHGRRPPAPVATVALAAAARVAVVTVTQVEAMPLLDHAPAPLRRLAMELLDAAGGWDTVLTAFPPILLSPDPSPDRSGIVIARHIARVSCAAILARQAAPAARLDSSARFGRLVRFMAVPFVAFWLSWFQVLNSQFRFSIFWFFFL